MHGCARVGGSVRGHGPPDRAECASVCGTVRVNFNLDDGHGHTANDAKPLNLKFFPTGSAVQRTTLQRACQWHRV